MKITQFDRPVCRNLGEEILNALKPLENKFGISFSRKGGSFSNTNYTMKIDVAIVAKDGTILSREAEDFKKYCHLYNLEANDLGKTFKDDVGTSWEVTGLAFRSHKYPILVKRIKDGRSFKIGERMVQKGLGRKVKEITPW